MVQLSSESITEATKKANDDEAKKLIVVEQPIDITLYDLPTEEAISAVGALTPLATASLEAILRNPHKYPSQAVAAAKLVYERKLGAIPDTMIQNNMQFIVKWED